MKSMNNKVPSKYSICDKKSIKIRRLLLDLEWVQPKYKQKRAMRKLSKLRGEELKWLIFPNNYSQKSAWENSAKVLQMIGYPAIKDILPKLFYSMADPNWPGALEIRDLLMTVSNDILLENIEEYMGDCPDEPYDSIEYMFISEIVFKKGIKEEDFSNINCYNILKMTYNS